MFRLYYFFNNNPSLIFTNDDLGPCLEFIKINRFIPCRCTIISPNNRKITFTTKNDIVFDGLN